MRSHILVAFALVSLIMPSRAVGQQGARWRDSAQRLDVAVRALRDSMLQGDSTATEVSRRGDLVIAASPNQRRNALDAFARFMQVRNRRFNEPALPSSAGFRIVMRTQVERAGDSAGIVILSGLPDRDDAVRTQRSVPAGDVGKGLIDRYGEMMIASVPALAAWIENPPPLSQGDKERRDEAMYSFVTSTGAIQQRCAAGGIVACNVALNVRHIDGPENGGRYSPFMRTDLLFFALDAGGPGSWSRLRSAGDSGVSAMLAAAAQMPADSVIARWRANLLALRPATAVIAPSTALLSVTWIGILLLGALGASKWA